MLHPDIEIRWKNDLVGYGLYATAPIAAGTMVYVQDALDQVIPPGSPLLHDPRYAEWIDKFCFIDAAGNHIVCWDASKYVNHCCHYNTLATAYGCEIAIRDIQTGEEITDDYLAFNLEEDMPLICDFTDCRKLLRPGDFEQYAPTWDEEIHRALQGFLKADQPLSQYLPAEHRQALLSYLQGGASYRSVDGLRYRPG
jgi:uncharacterized protein